MNFVKRKTLFFFILIFQTSFGFGQNQMSEVRTTLDSLTSEQFSGRGYTNHGMERAADFLVRKYQEFGLEKVGNSYYQSFTFPINIIQNAELKIDGNELEYGRDFIVKPNSKGQNFHQKEIYHFDPLAFKEALSSELNLVKFIECDMKSQLDKHLVFPPFSFEVDSLNAYYKNWATFYRPNENRKRAIFYFSKDKFISSLSQTQDSISEFIVNEKWYTKRLKIDDYKIESRFEPSFKANNIVGKIEGNKRDSLIVITAHYDHLGKVGNVFFPGASDNASGVVFVLELAKYFSKVQPNHTLVFICFGAEEAGLVGSTYFVENPMIDLTKVKFLLNFDIMGAGEEGIQIVNSTIFTKEFEKLNELNTQHRYLKQIKKRGEACNSDHCPFYEKGVPSFFIYTLGGPGFYHDIDDKADTLSLSEFEDLLTLFQNFIQDL